MECRIPVEVEAYAKKAKANYKSIKIIILSVELRLGVRVRAGILKLF